MITLILFVVGVAIFTPLLQRDLRRSAQRQEYRRLQARRLQARRNLTAAAVQLQANMRAFATAGRKASKSFAEMQQQLLAVKQHHEKKDQGPR